MADAREIFFGNNYLIQQPFNFFLSGVYPSNLQLKIAGAKKIVKKILILLVLIKETTYL